MTDEWLSRQMTEAFECFAAKPVPEHVFSAEFERKMENMICQGKRKNSVWKSVGWGRKALTAAGISLVIAVSAAFGVKANRERFFEMMTQWISGMKQMTYQVEETSGQLSSKEPSYISEGYRKVHQEILDNEMLMVEYENDEGNQIVFTRERVSEGLVIYEDGEFDFQEEMVINGHEVLYTQREGDMEYRMISWYDKDLYYTIMTDGVEKQELIKIMESVEWN